MVGSAVQNKESSIRRRASFDLLSNSAGPESVAAFYPKLFAPIASERHSLRLVVELARQSNFRAIHDEASLSLVSTRWRSSSSKSFHFPCILHLGTTVD